MVMLSAALLFGAADMWFTVVPTYGAQAITVGRLWALISVRSMDLVETLITRHLWSPIWDIGSRPGPSSVCLASYFSSSAGRKSPTASRPRRSLS